MMERVQWMKIIFREIDSGGSRVFVEFNSNNNDHPSWEIIGNFLIATSSYGAVNGYPFDTIDNFITGKAVG